MATRYLINGKILGPEEQLQTASLKMAAGKIVEIYLNSTPNQNPSSKEIEKEIETLDLEGKLILPGLIDMHVHLREPGYEYKETIATGTKAAARGGFTTVACMPNTKPVLDSVEQIQFVRQRAEETASVQVIPIPAMTQGMQGKKLCDYQAYRETGIFAISDDGNGVQDPEIMRQIFEAATPYQLVVMQHCECNHLSSGGVLHEGEKSRKEKVKGIPSASEYEMIRRDLEWVRKWKTRYHVLHLSTKEAVQLVREAKKEGLPVTAEVTPHHLLLVDEEIPGLDTNFKMNPPLRSKEDRKAVIEGLADGTIDIIATDHAPHSVEEKARDIYHAPFGVVGSETAFPLLYTHLVLKEKALTLSQLIECMSTKPAQIFGLPGGKIEIGAEANLTVIDLESESPVEPQNFCSKSRNTPFPGWPLKGWSRFTFWKGEKVWG